MSCIVKYASEHGGVDAMDFTVTFGVASPKAIWEISKETAKCIAESESIWNSLSPEEREAAVEVIQAGVKHIGERKDWIEHALTRTDKPMATGTFIEVSFCVLLTEKETP